MFCLYYGGVIGPLLAEIGIYKRKQKIKKERKHALDQEKTITTNKKEREHFV